MIDLLVVGGGPAGLATALEAARAGLHVEVLEPRSAPIDKACGEGLMPGGVAALARLDVDPPGHPLRGITYRRGVHRASADFPSGSGLGVRRTDLHVALAAAVERAGVPVVGEAAGRITQDADGVRVGTRRARYLVAADGLHSPIRRQLGLERTAHGPRRWGLRAHWAVAPWTDYVEVHWADGAEAYVTPIASDRVGVAVLTRQRGSYDERLDAFPELRARLAGVQCGSVRAAGPLRQRVSGRVAGRVLLVGDAAGYVDALTGEGLSLGFAGARAAVAAIGRGDPSGYEREYRRFSRRYRVLTEVLVQSTRTRPARAVIVPAAARFPRLFAATVAQLAGPSSR